MFCQLNHGNHRKRPWKVDDLPMSSSPFSMMCFLLWLNGFTLGLPFIPHKVKLLGQDQQTTLESVAKILRMVTCRFVQNSTPQPFWPLNDNGVSIRRQPHGKRFGAVRPTHVFMFSFPKLVMSLESIRPKTSWLLTLVSKSPKWVKPSINGLKL